MSGSRLTFRLSHAERARLVALGELAGAAEGMLVRECVARYAERTAQELRSEADSMIPPGRGRPSAGEPAGPSLGVRPRQRPPRSPGRPAPELDVAAVISRARRVPVEKAAEWIGRRAVEADGRPVARRHWPVQDEGSITVAGRPL